MTSQASTFEITPGSSVGEILDHHPSALELFQDYQAGTDGVCVIKRDDSLRELCNRFGKPVNGTIETLRRMEGEN